MFGKVNEGVRKQEGLIIDQLINRGRSTRKRRKCNDWKKSEYMVVISFGMHTRVDLSAQLVVVILNTLLRPLRS